MSGGYSILVCDDDRDLRETVGEYLERRGHTVHLASGGAALDDRFGRAPAVDLVLLDIRMPGEDGLSILRRLRADTDTAVIMLTAEGDAVDRIVGLELGADDYLAKPVDLRELDARVRAVMRRVALRADQPARAGRADGPVHFDGITLDLCSAALTGRDGEGIALTAMEFRLLKVFVENRGRVLNRDQLLEMAHDRGWDPFDRSIDIRISRLRRKIERTPSEPQIVRTVRGLGYVFDPPSGG